jgi:hypothetical protein
MGRMRRHSTTLGDMEQVTGNEALVLGTKRIVERTYICIDWVHRKDTHAIVPLLGELGHFLVLAIRCVSNDLRSALPATRQPPSFVFTL